MEGLLRTISSANSIPLDPVQDLAIVLGQALSVASLSSDVSRCQFCPLAPEISCLAGRLRIIYDSTMKDRFLLWSMRRLKAISGAFTEDLEDFRMLKQRLQSILDIQGRKSTNAPSSPLNSGVLDGAHDFRIDRSKFTNVAGNSTENTSSNFVFNTYNLDIGVRSTLALLLAFFVFRLF